MASDPDRFVTDLMPQNLALAGRCAAQPEVRLSEALKDKVRWALSNGPRIPPLICGHALPRVSRWVNWVIRASCAGTGRMAPTCCRH